MTTRFGGVPQHAVPDFPTSPLPGPGDKGPPPELSFQFTAEDFETLPSKGPFNTNVGGSLNLQGHRKSLRKLNRDLNEAVRTGNTGLAEGIRRSINFTQRRIEALERQAANVGGKQSLDPGSLIGRQASPTTPGGDPTSPTFIQDLISEIFGQRPELAFSGNVAQSGLRPNQQRFLRGRASDFLGRFDQAIGGQLTQGDLPTLTPEKFFGNLDFQNELFKFSPRQRGTGSSQFAPRTRFL